MVGIINSFCVTNIHLKFESVYYKNRKIVRWCSIQSKLTQYFAYNENLEHNHSFEGGFFQQHPHKRHLTGLPSGNERNVIELIDINLLLLDMGHLCECVRVYTTL